MHVAHLAADLEGEGFATTLLAGSVTEDEGDMGYYAGRMGVDPVPIPGLDRRLRPLAALRALLFLYRRFRRDRPRVVHTHTAMAGAVGRGAALLARVPIVVHTYHGHVLGGSYFSRSATTLFLTIERVLARGTDALVVLTEGQRREMLEGLRIGREGQYRVISLGLDLERFVRAPIGSAEEEAVRREARRSLGIAPGAPVVGVVGRLVSVKNHELLLEAIPQVVERLNAVAGGGSGGLPGGVPGESLGGSSGESPGGSPGDALRVVLVGDGERRAALETRAAELGVAGHLIWTGWRDDLEALYPAFDVTVLTSHDEGTPVALLESLAAGVPVVSRAVGGIPEVLEGGRWGRLVDETASGRQGGTDSSAMAEAIARALMSPPALSRREAARAHVLARFGRARLAADMSRLYEELLNMRGGGGGGGAAPEASAGGGSPSR